MKIIQYFAKKGAVAAVYLYGSQARGDAKTHSDIDLAVLLNREAQSLHDLPQTAFAPDLAKITGREVEIQDLKSCSIDFAHRVITEGKLLVAGDEKARITFEEKVLRVYFDLKPAFDQYDKYLAEITKRGELHVRYI